MCGSMNKRDMLKLLKDEFHFFFICPAYSYLKVDVLSATVAEVFDSNIIFLVIMARATEKGARDKLRQGLKGRGPHKQILLVLSSYQSIKGTSYRSLQASKYTLWFSNLKFPKLL